MLNHYIIRQERRPWEYMEQWLKVTIVRFRNIFWWNLSFLGYIKNNEPNLAIDLFNTIEHPNEILFNLVFNACAQLRNAEALDLVKKVSSEMSKSFYSNFRLLTSLLDSLIKCGDMKEAESLFNRTANKTLSMYGTMMKGKN